MHPLVLQTGLLGLNAFGVLACVALVGGACWTRASARRRGASDADALQAYVVASLGALLLAQIGYLLGNLALPELATAPLGGLHGSAGLVGALLGSRLHFRRRELAWRVWLDAQTATLGLALCLGQLGSYLLGADYGAPLPLGAPGWLERLGSYPRWTSSATIEALGAGAPAWVNQLGQHLLEPDSPSSLPLHPAQLYLAGAALGLLALAAYRRGRARFAGEEALLALITYAALMVVLEPLRDDPRRGTLPLLASSASWLALGLGGILAALLHGPLSLRVGARLAVVAVVFVLALALASPLLLEHFTNRDQRPLALAQLVGLGLAWSAALAWRRWCKLATHTLAAHIGVTSGPHVPTSSAPGGPLQ
jgi:phosphatidylglycerol:prolipoprotein diacylglycerol transferase